jgi:hypothetical protein
MEALKKQFQKKIINDAYYDIFNHNIINRTVGKLSWYAIFHQVGVQIQYNLRDFIDDDLKNKADYKLIKESINESKKVS